MDRGQALSAAAVAAALAVTFGGSPTAADAAPPEFTQGPMIIAHRAGTGDFPENTLLALANAVEAGVDGVWVTVQASGDGVPVLYRPADLTTLTNGSGPVNSHTAQQLQQLNAGWNFTGGNSRRTTPRSATTERHDSGNRTRQDSAHRGEARREGRLRDLQGRQGSDPHRVQEDGRDPRSGVCLVTVPVFRRHQGPDRGPDERAGVLSRA